MTRLATLDAAVRRLIEDSTSGGHGLLVVPTGAADILYRTRPDVPGGIPVEQLRDGDIAEALADVERLLDAPNWMRWPDVELAEADA